MGLSETLNSLLERHTKVLLASEDPNERYVRVAAIGDIAQLALEREIQLDPGIATAAFEAAIPLADWNREIREILIKN